MKMRDLLDFIGVTSLIVNNNKTKVVHFCLHTHDTYHVHLYTISESIDQLRSIELYRETYLRM